MLHAEVAGRQGWRRCPRWFRASPMPMLREVKGFFRPLHIVATHKESGRASYLECRPIPGMACWDGVRGEWWFDNDYLGENLDPLSSYFGTVEAYSELPRARGTGHKLEAFVKAAELAMKHDRAQGVFSRLLGPRG